MIIVHETFICKPGNASKLAKKFKEAMKDSKELVNIMTDLTGQFNRVILVSQFENMEAYEKNWENFMKDPEAVKKMDKAMEGYQEMYLSGSREIYRAW